MSSLKRHEGYLMIDNRVSEGVPDNLVIANGLPVGAGRGLFETATYTCNHCSFVVVMNSMRERPRGYCTGCDRYICDACTEIRHRTQQCRPMEMLVNEGLELELKNPDLPSSILFNTK